MEQELYVWHLYTTECVFKQQRNVFDPAEPVCNSPLLLLGIVKLLESILLEKQEAEDNIK